MGGPVRQTNHQDFRFPRLGTLSHLTKRSSQASSALLRHSAFGLRHFRSVNLERAKIPALPQKRAMNITKNLGMLLLAIYLILSGLMGLIGFSLGILMPILALAAGILILIGR